MSMCRVFFCVVGRGCLLWPVHSLVKILLVFDLLHFVLQGQICSTLGLPLLCFISQLWGTQGEINPFVFIGRTIAEIKVLVAQLFPTLCDPWISACQASLFITIYRRSLRLRSIESVMPSSHFILGRPLLLLPPIPPSIRVFFQSVNTSHEVAKVLEFQL